MKIRIPEPVGRIWDRIGDVVNVPIWTRGQFEIRRIDVLIILAGIGCTAYYWIASGWQGALQGAALYTAVAMMAMWML